MSRPFVKLQREIILFLVLFGSMTIAGFWLLNGGALIKNMEFLFSAAAEDSLPAEPLFAFPRPSSSAVSAGNTPVSTPSSKIHSYRLVIPNIRVSTPVIIPKSGDMKAILASLEEGVGVYPGSSLPGREGRSIILGHSSRASWYRGEYATIFTLIKELGPGDLFYIVDDGTSYIYEVISKKSMTPAEANAMFAGPTDGSEVDLVTCYPIGSASKRMVVRARLVLTQIK